MAWRGAAHSRQWHPKVKVTPTGVSEQFRIDIRAYGRTGGVSIYCSHHCSLECSVSVGRTVLQYCSRQDLTVPTSPTLLFVVRCAVCTISLKSSDFDPKILHAHESFKGVRMETTCAHRVSSGQNFSDWQYSAAREASHFEQSVLDRNRSQIGIDQLRVVYNHP